MRNKKTILISGGSGSLASQIYNVARDFNVINPKKTEMDITNLNQVEDFIDKFKPDYFIHCGAYTRPMSKHQAYPEESIGINIVGTANVSIACLRSDTKLIYISTDYVYPGLNGNYSEESPVSPYSNKNDGISKYGWSKLGGECSVRFLNDFLIIRACLSEYPFPHSKALIDIRKSYIYSKDAAPIILDLLDEKGVINLGGKARSVYEFARIDNKDIEPMSTKDVPDVEIAPDTTLDITKLERILERKLD